MSKSKSEVVEAIRQTAAKLGRVPVVADLEVWCGLTRKEIRRHFNSLRQAFRAAGLDPSLDGSRNTTAALLEDWAKVARKMGRLPSSKHYLLAGRFSRGSFYNRFGAWNHVPVKFREFAQQSGEKGKWDDVLEMIERQASLTRREAAEGRPSILKQAAAYTRRRSPIFPERPVFGAPLPVPGLAYEPVNEAGVILLFGIAARQLGFHVERLQPDFPDCEAMREIQPGKWQRVRIEFEFESRNFRIHRHPAGQCDVIVCWRHNWSECPSGLEVIELSQVLGRSNAVARPPW